MQLANVRRTPSISIDEIWAEDNRLTSRISFDEELRPYFDTGIFYAKYDTSIGDVDPSILAIPVLSSILVVSWATGARIVVDRLDRKFLASIKDIQETLREKKWYPNFSFNGSVIVKNEESLDFGEPDRVGLLYGGEVDAIASYMKNRDLNPNLIMIRGLPDDPLYQSEPWSTLKDKSISFAKELGTSISFIETNMYDMIHEPGVWWANVYHSLACLGVCAPLSVKKRFEKLIIASSYSKEYDPKWGSHPTIDEKIKWGNMKVLHDSFDLSRQQKVKRYIAPYLKESTLPLKVCWTGRVMDRENVKTLFSKGVMNCGECDKCRRTIVGLLLEGADPARSGFDMDSFSLPGLREEFVSKRLKLDHESNSFWFDIQRNISSRSKVPAEKNESKEFFEWLERYDISRNMSHESEIRRAYKSVRARARQGFLNKARKEP